MKMIKNHEDALYRLVDRELLGAAVVVMIAGGGLGILFNILAPRGLFRILGGNSGKPVVVEPVNSAGMVAAKGPEADKGPVNKVKAVGAKYAPKIIDLEKAKAVFKKGSAVWVDARSESSYNYGHIPGAVNIPSSDFDRAYARQSSRLSRTGSIVVYCEGPDCDQAEHVLEKFITRGYRNLVHFRQGWNSWEAAELPQEPK